MSDIAAHSDAAPEPPPRAEPRGQVAGERTISPVASKLALGGRSKLLVTVAAGVGCVVLLAATWKPAAPKAAKAPLQPASQVVKFETSSNADPTLGAPGDGAPNLNGAPPPGSGDAAAPATRDGAEPSQPSQAQAAAQQARQARAAEIQAIRAAPMMAFSESGGQSAPTGPNLLAAVRTDNAAGGSELDQLRRASTLGQTRAQRLGDRNTLILAGTVLPCVLMTAMDTATPGYVTCVIPTDVYSESGGVVLLEKGSKVFGEYRSSMRQGQRRLFALWTRVVTPQGVAIKLSSPASDALGRAGFDGDIDTHFWERFGGALLLSTVDDGISALADQGRDTYGQTTRLPSDAAGIALQNSVNIPPSLRKPQGSEVSIFVADDLDFSGVYGLKAR